MVEFPAVQLDDETGGGPEDVDLATQDIHVGAARRKLVGMAESLEAVLER
jgi:hypothetical protein